MIASQDPEACHWRVTCYDTSQSPTALPFAGPFPSLLLVSWHMGPIQLHNTQQLVSQLLCKPFPLLPDLSLWCYVWGILACCLLLQWSCWPPTSSSWTAHFISLRCMPPPVSHQAPHKLESEQTYPLQMKGYYVDFVALYSHIRCTYSNN